MIPSKYFSKIGIHEVEMEGVKVQASHVTDNTSVIDDRISQLMAALDKERPVVGVDVKVTASGKKKWQKITTNLLILYGGNCCLVMNLAYMSSIPDSLCNFLVDKRICFVGTGVVKKVGPFHSSRIVGNTVSFRQLSLSHVVEVGDLAARVLRKPNLSKCGLQDLDMEVRKSTAATDLPGDQTSRPGPNSKAGVSRVWARWMAKWTGSIGPRTSESVACPNWNAEVFSDDEIKYVIHDAYTCCAIGEKMMGILGGVN